MIPAASHALCGKAGRRAVYSDGGSSHGACSSPSGDVVWSGGLQPSAETSSGGCRARRHHMTTGKRQSRIAEMMESGATFDEVEADVIDGAPCDSDEKAALWLYAWSFMPRGQQRYEANQHLRRHAARNRPTPTGGD